MTRDQIADRVRENLYDAGITYYAAIDINDSIQDGYDDVAVFTGCIQKSTNINITSNLTYYDMVTLISDFFAIVAAYNNTTNRWIHFDNLKSFDQMRIDWETWEGSTPRWGGVSNYKYVTFMPRMASASGTITIYYRATAPTLGASTTPLIHTDEQGLLELYATGDLLEQAEEFAKSDRWLGEYFAGLKKYKERIGKLALSDYFPILTSQAS